MGFGGAVLLVGVCVLGQLDFPSAAFEAPHCVTMNETPRELEVPQSADRDKWVKEGLDAHNKFRKKHGVPPLVLNPKMCRSAQWTAHQNAINGTRNLFTREMEGKFVMSCGESLAEIEAPVPGSAIRIVESWYDYRKNYDFVKHEPKPETFVWYFLSVVWKDTKEMCMSYAVSKDNKKKYFVVAHYFPAAAEWYGAEVNAENVLNSANHLFKTGIILTSILCIRFF